MTRVEVLEILEEAMFWDGLDEAIIGVAERINLSVVAYDIDKIIDILMRDGMDYEEAIEYYDVNINGAWIGELTPVHLKLTIE
jgi:hypothetical protein